MFESRRRELFWRTAGASYEEIAERLSREIHASVKEAEGAFPDLVKSTSVGSATLDRAHNRLLIRMKMDVGPIGTVQALSVGHLGSEGIVFLHCYAAEQD